MKRSGAAPVKASYSGRTPGPQLESIHPDDRERIWRATDSKQANGMYDETYRIIRPDKTQRAGSMTGPSSIRNEAGEVYRVVGTAEDITEHRKLEEQFRHAQKMEAVGQLAGGVAHDFNNILSVIQMQSDLMRLEMMACRMNRDHAWMRSPPLPRAPPILLRQPLLFSRHEKVQPHDLDLGESISDLTKMLRRILGEDIQIHFKFTPQPLHIHADPRMIDQIVMNLTINSA